MVAATILNENQRLTNQMLEYEKLQENMKIIIFMTFVIPAIISITEKNDKIKLLIIKIYCPNSKLKEEKYMAKKKCNKSVHVKAHNRCKPGTHKKK